MTDTSLSAAAQPSRAATPGLLRRMACWCYEGVLLFGVVFIPAYFFGVITNTRHALHNRLGLQIVLLLVLVAYFVWFWSKGGTLAMKTWRIRVCDVQQRRLSLGRALLRFVYCQIWFLPLWLQGLLHTLGAAHHLAFVLFSQAVWPLLWVCSARFQCQRQFWHDIWAGTRLIHSAIEPSGVAQSVLHK